MGGSASKMVFDRELRFCCRNCNRGIYETTNFTIFNRTEERALGGEGDDECCGRELWAIDYIYSFLRESYSARRDTRFGISYLSHEICI